jgi:hypothetical protein
MCVSLAQQGFGSIHDACCCATKDHSDIVVVAITSGTATCSSRGQRCPHCAPTVRGIASASLHLTSGPRSVGSGDTESARHLALGAMFYARFQMPGVIGEWQRQE